MMQDDDPVFQISSISAAETSNVGLFPPCLIAHLEISHLGW